jgi:hypothetical protein
MAKDDEREERAAAEPTRVDVEIEEEDDDDAGSPFDHPAFLPVLLWALALWFGYDGWINQDPDMLEHVTFNRVGFGVLVALGSWFTFQAVRDKRRAGDE